jgi:hypothetical protein
LKNIFDVANFPQTALYWSTNRVRHSAHYRASKP